MSRLLPIFLKPAGRSEPAAPNPAPATRVAGEQEQKKKSGQIVHRDWFIHALVAQAVIPAGVAQGSRQTCAMPHIALITQTLGKLFSKGDFMTALAIQFMVIVIFIILGIACPAFHKRYQERPGIAHLLFLSATVYFASLLMPFIIEIFYSVRSGLEYFTVFLCIICLFITILIIYRSLYTVQSLILLIIIGFIFGIPATAISTFCIVNFPYYIDIMRIIQIGIPDVELIELISLTGAALIFSLLLFINHISLRNNTIAFHIHALPMYAAIAFGAMAAMTLALRGALNS